MKSGLIMGGLLSGLVLAAPIYETRPASRDGIGKWYLGRELAHFMSHEGADWLERPEREQEEDPAHLMAALAIAPGERVADMGAGTGYFTRRLAAATGPSGVVYAVDIQLEMLALLTNKMARAGFTNIVPVLGGESDPRLPADTLDLILMVDVYHEFEFPHEMTAALCRALKPGGRMVIVEYRGEDPAVPIKPLHKMTEAQVRREMESHPLRWVRTSSILPRQHIIVFERTPD